jgi:predicted O-methyltransferase YrrM
MINPNRLSYKTTIELRARDLARAFGFLYEGEVYALQVLALSLPEGAKIVNIWAGSGTSALAMLEARPDLGENFYTVDVSEGGPLGGMQNEKNAFANAGLPFSHHQILGDSKKVKWPHGLVDLCFIDGDHSREGVRGDIDAWLPRVKPGGLLAFHDYERDVWPEVAKAVEEMTAHCCHVFTVDTLKVVRLPLK